MKIKALTPQMLPHTDHIKRHARLCYRLREYEPIPGGPKQDTALARHRAAIWRMTMNDREEPAIVIAALSLGDEEPMQVDEDLFTACLLACGAPAPTEFGKDESKGITDRIDWCEKLYDWHEANRPDRSFAKFSKAYDIWWKTKKENMDES